MALILARFEVSNDIYFGAMYVCMRISLWIVGDCDLFQACIMFNMTESIFKTKKRESVEKCPEQEWAFPFHKEFVRKKLYRAIGIRI